MFFLIVAKGGPSSLGWMLVAKVKKKKNQAHSKSEMIYTCVLKPLEVLIMLHLKQLRWCRALSTLDSPPLNIFFLFFSPPHPETVSSNSQVHTALLFSHQGTKIN